MKLFEKLPLHVKKQAKEAFSHFKENPWHLGLHFKCVNPQRARYSVRIGIDYRALGQMEGDEITWFWIGHHSEYDHMIGRK
jgi:hypothetical protein